MDLALVFRNESTSQNQEKFNSLSIIFMFNFEKNIWMNIVHLH